MAKSERKPGTIVARAVFVKTVSDTEQARVELVRLTKRARKIGADKTP